VTKPRYSGFVAMHKQIKIRGSLKGKIRLTYKNTCIGEFSMKKLLAIMSIIGMSMGTAFAQSAQGEAASGGQAGGNSATASGGASGGAGAGAAGGAAAGGITGAGVAGIAFGVAAAVAVTNDDNNAPVSVSQSN
jgi:hypothetical protein